MKNSIIIVGVIVLVVILYFAWKKNVAVQVAPESPAVTTVTKDAPAPAPQVKTVTVTNTITKYVPASLTRIPATKKNNSSFR